MRCAAGAPLGVLLCDPRVTAHAVGRLRFFFFFRSRPRPPWPPPPGALRGVGGRRAGRGRREPRPVCYRLGSTGRGHRRSCPSSGRVFRETLCPWCDRLRAAATARWRDFVLASLLPLEDRGSRKRGHSRRRGKAIDRESGHGQDICNTTGPTVPITGACRPPAGVRVPTPPSPLSLHPHPLPPPPTALLTGVFTAIENGIASPHGTVGRHGSAPPPRDTPRPSS